MSESVKSSFYFTRSVFLDVLRSMQSLIEKKLDQENTPIRLVLHENGTLLMVIFNGSMFMESCIDVDISVFESTSSEIYLPAFILYDLVRRIDDERITFLVNDKTVVMEYKEGTVVLSKLLPISNYFTNPMLEEPYFRVNSSQLVETLKLLKATMALEDIRDQFKGISLSIENTMMSLWSTDGIKMCIARMNIEGDGSIKIEGIWTRKFIETLLTIPLDSLVEFQMSSRYVRYKLNKTTVFSPLINAKLIDHRSVFNETDTPTITVEIDSVYLQKKIDIMMVLSGTDGSVLFDFTEQPTISCSNKQKSDRAVEKVNCNVIGDPAKFFINPSIMSSFLRNFKTTVEILFYDKSKLIVLRKKGDLYPIYITKSMTIKNV